MSLESLDKLPTHRILLVCFFLLLLAGIIYAVYVRGLAKRECNAMETLYGELNGKIQPISAETHQNKLVDYYIKTAYNCCNGGGYQNDFVDLCVVKQLLKQGVRALDMEIFSVNDQAVIASSTTDTYYRKETYNDIPFQNFLETVLNYAFATGTAPNSSDPLFLHFRFKTNHPKIYQQIADLFKKTPDWFLGKEYSFEDRGHNFTQTPLAELKRKIVILVDRSNLSFLDNKDFYEFVNLTSESNFMRVLSYTQEIKNTPDINELIEFNKIGMTLGTPDTFGTENPSAVVMRECGIQFLGMRFPTFDANLQESNLFFDLAGTAFVLKPEKLRFKIVTIDPPNDPDPNLSYATREIKSDFYQFEI